MGASGSEWTAKVGALVGWVSVAAAGIWANATFAPQWRIRRIEVVTKALRPFTDTARLRRRLAAAADTPYRSLGSFLAALQHETSQEVYIKEARFKVDHSGAVDLSITEHMPLMRVVPPSGAHYYVAEDSTMLPVIPRSVVHVPAVTGSVTERYRPGNKIQSEPLRWALRVVSVISQDPAWSSIIGQVHLASDGAVRLITRPGRHSIFIGKDPSTIPHQMRVLQKVLPYVMESPPRIIDLRYPKTAVVKPHQNAR